MNKILLMRYYIKKHFLLLFLISYFNVQVTAQKKIFIRIYPKGSSKVIKGVYSGYTDSALMILSKQQTDTISYFNIQHVRTRRSTGHDILISAVAGGVAGTAIGILTHKDPPP